MTYPTPTHSKDCAYHLDQYSWECDCGAYVQHLAEQKVLKVRGFWDAPGFDACVKAEMKNIRDRMAKKGAA